METVYDVLRFVLSHLHKLGAAEPDITKALAVVEAADPAAVQARAAEAEFTAADAAALADLQAKADAAKATAAAPTVAQPGGGFFQSAGE